MKLADVLPRLEAVRPCAGGWVARCPAHSDRNPSLSIREVDGKVLLKCFAGCSFEAIRDALGARPRRPVLGLPGAAPAPLLDDAKRTEIALRVWRASEPAAGAPVECYLRARGITIPVPPSLRFHPSVCHPSDAYLPAIIAAVQVATGAIVAVHRTYLARDGSRKANVEPSKAALGPIRSAAVRLAPAGETLCLAEGIETALSVLQATRIPTWAALGTSNLARVELPECVRELIVCADSDEPGERAAREAAARFMREGRRVRIVRPMRGDFNDALRV